MLGFSGRSGHGGYGAQPPRMPPAVDHGRGFGADPHGIVVDTKHDGTEADRAPFNHVRRDEADARVLATALRSDLAVLEVDAASQPASIGFSRPSDAAESVAAQPRGDRREERGPLGVSLQPLDEELAGVLGAPDGKGALVASVEPDSPAARGGLRSGDIVISVAGKAVQRQRDLAVVLADAKPGSVVTVTVLRDGRRMEHRVTMG
jgi:S1-C subfamily serine protease